MTTLLRDTIEALGFAGAFDFENQEDFTALWADPAAFRENVIIIWNDVFLDKMMGDINSKDFLGPIEWAAARQAAWLPTTDWPRPPRTLIIDLNGRGHAGLPASMIYASLNRDQIDWLRVVSVSDALEMWRMDGLFQWPEKPATKPAIGFSPIWKSHILQVLTAAPDTHHSLSNIIGVSLLSKNAVQSPHTVALRALFKVVKLLPKADDESKDGEPLDPNPLARAILLDDMADRWGPFIRDTLRLEPAQLECPATGQGETGGGDALDHLLTRLEAFASEPYQRRFLTWDDFIPVKTPPVISTPAEFILFLDLRFFGSEGGSLSRAETNFIERLEGIANHLEAQTDGEGKPPYPKIRSEEIELATDGACSTRPETPGHRKALTFLARLLSLADPSLPIILFSSSNQHLMLKELLPYANIITGFQKPSFRQAPGEWKLVKQACCDSLRVAWKRGQHILKQRKALRWLKERKQTPPTRTNVTKCSRIDIFLDESGRENELCLGGFALLSGKTPFNHASFVQSLNGINVNPRYLFGQSKEADTVQQRKPPNCLPKGNALFVPERWKDMPDFVGVEPHALLSQIASRLAGCLEEQGASMLLLALNGSGSSRRDWLPSSEKFVDVELFDSKHRKLMMGLLEVALFEHPELRSLIEKGACVGIHLGTRKQKLKNSVKNTERARLREIYGVRWASQAGEYEWQTLGSHEAMLVIDQVLANRGERLPGKGKLVQVRAAMLKEDFDEPHNGFNENHPLLPPYQMHYLADWFAHLSLHRADDVKNDTFLNARFCAGFLENLDRPSFFRDLIKASRHWEGERRAEAVRLVVNCLEEIQSADALPRNYATASSLILDRASRWQRELSGADLGRLFAYPAEEGGGVI